jgi:hypothetical protein
MAPEAGAFAQCRFGAGFASAPRKAREGNMELKSEGVAFPPVPIAEDRALWGRAELLPRDVVQLHCEMCGAVVMGYHCKRICLRCGFMTGCSEGI